MHRVVLTLSALAMLAAGCGRTPMNDGVEVIPGDGGWQDVGPLPDGNAADLLPRPDGALPDGPTPFDARLDAPRPDGPRPDGGRQDGPRQDGPRQDGPRPDAPLPYDGPRQDGPRPDGATALDGSTPGVIDCGNTTCNVATQDCCVTFSGATCIAKGTQCQGARASCDGPEDCPNAGQICCGISYGPNRGLSCTNGSCNSGERICHLDIDCPSAERCCGDDTIAGMSVQYCLATADCPNIYPAPGVVCGAAVCYSPQICCQSYSGGTCTLPSACTQGLPVACDGPEDCGGTTPVCCGQLTSGTSCVGSGSCSSGMTGGVVCHTTADCPSGQTCTDLSTFDVRVCF
jgi:hypothetical protein